MLIGSLVELYVGLHSYLCFSLLKKLFSKAGSTPPWYLAICRASQAFFLTQSRHLLDTWWIDRESSCLLDSSSIPGGSIEKAPASSIASRHLVDRSSFCSWIWWVVPRYLLDTSVVDDHFLDTYLDSFLDTSWHLHLSSFTEGLYIPSSQSDSHFFNLSWLLSFFSPKLSHLTPISILKGFFKLFQDFLLMVSF